MIWQHFRTFLWLRWRLMINQFGRGGRLNAILAVVVVVAAVVLAVPLFIGSLVFGLFTFPNAQPVFLLLGWDAAVVAFLFFWLIGLLNELQRTESLSLSKFMHLPVSVNGAFIINYVSSLLCPSLIVFVPIFFGLALALAFAKGAWLLVALPLTVAFLLMITALTYQFQGWLASLMSNPRRRRTVVVVMTGLFILLFQLPNLLNMSRGQRWQLKGNDSQKKYAIAHADLMRALKEQEIDLKEFDRRQQALLEEQKIVDREELEKLGQTAKLINAVLPIGWLPLGITTAVEGRAWPAILGLGGLTLIGSVSLWRAYRTTVGLYQGQASNRTVRTAEKVATPVPATPRPAVEMLERKLPGVSEPVSAIALAGLRSLLRSPEAKMMLLTPLLMSAMFGSMLFGSGNETPDWVNPLIAIGALAFSLMGMGQLLGNQFGFDRDGFRVYVLSAASRRDILLGKNLAIVPLAVGMAAVLLLVVEVLRPMRLEHLLSMVPQFVSMFLLFCILMNLTSILAPVPIAAGTMRPANVKMSVVLLQVAMTLVLFPLMQLPTLLPLAVEVLLEWMDLTAGLPVALLLSLVECALIVVLYRIFLNWQGDVLQAREQRILESVTNRAA